MSGDLFFINNGTVEFDSFVSLSDNDLSLVKNHVELTRHLIEIRELYLLFKFNLDSLQRNYVLMGDGSILRNGKPADSDSDYIAINDHIINIISSGRTLIESMETFIGLNFEHDDEFSKNYLAYYHKVYDESFNYRMLIRLRDYSQHGHLPVSKEGHNYYIDIYNILYAPHYNHNGKIKKELVSITEEIITVYADTPTISLTMAISEFTVKLLSIYYEFWLTVDNMVNDSTISLEEVVKTNEKNITHNMFFYEIIDGNAHCIPVQNDPIKMLQTNKDEANNVLLEYSEADNTLKSRMVTIHVSKNKQQIEIGLF